MARKAQKDKARENQTYLMVNRAMALDKQKVYTNCLDLQAMVDLYFEEADLCNKPYTVIGLTLYLGFTDSRLKRFIGKHEWARGIIESAKEHILESYQHRLMTQNNVAGLIFLLKNVYSWTDKREVHETGDRTINIQWGQPISDPGKPIIEGTVVSAKSIPTAHTTGEIVTQPATLPVSRLDELPEKRE